MPSYLNYNDQLFSSDQPLFTASNRSFKYGDGLFESILLYKGKIPFLQDHLERLHKGMQALHLSFVKEKSAAEWQAAILALCEKNNCTDYARIKLTVFRSGAGLYTPEVNEASFIIESATFEPAFFNNPAGIEVDIFSEVAVPANSISGYKTNNALPYVLAAIHKEQRHIDDVLLLNDSGNIAEATASNIFIIKNEKIYTPPLSEGCVAGVMRKNVLKIASKENFYTEEKPLKEADLAGADEAFLTNAIQGIKPVSQFRKKKYAVAITAILQEKLNESLIL